MEKVKVDIISGFLGAGKTYLIRKLLVESFKDDNICIIENEFGEVNIDGVILQEGNVNVKEISSGCICCSFRNNFKSALEEVIKNYNPSRVIIEPSGVAKLSDILNVFNTKSIKDNIDLDLVITVVDVTKFNIYLCNFGEFYKNQIAYAQTILLSRSDNLHIDELSKIIDEIGTINSKAQIVTTPLDCLMGSDIVEAEEKTNSIIKATFVKKHSAEDIFESWSIKTIKSYNKNLIVKILTLIKNDSNYGTVLRMKGIVQSDKDYWIKFDYITTDITIEKIPPSITGMICVIGTNLNKEKLEEIWKEEA